MSTGYTIGQLGKATNTNVETIRYYERIGLLPRPARSRGNQRVYSATELARLSFLRRARDLGFSMQQARSLMDLSDQRDRSCAAVDALARGHLEEVERKIADLQALRETLSTMIDHCARDTIADCRIIETLGPVSRQGD